MSAPAATPAAQQTVILGAGASTTLHLETLAPQQRRAVAAILDDDAGRAGQRLLGIPVLATTDYPLERVGRVIITSQMFRRRLTERAARLCPRAELVYAFDDERSLPARLGRLARELEDGWDATRSESALWFAADDLLVTLRRRLETLPTWRYGPLRQVEELAELRAEIDGLLDLDGAALLNVGCGPYHPLGLSVIAAAAGARRCVALDREPVLDERRAADAVAELAAEILRRPGPALADAAGRPPLRRVVLERLERHLDLERGTPRPGGGLEHRVEPIETTTLEPGRFDLAVSRDVFEHLDDVPAALAAIAGLLRGGGLAVLFIDLSDHRRYEDGQRYRHWSHLLDDGPTHLGTNRLRFGDYPPLFAAAGLETVRYVPREIEPLPAGVRASLRPMFQEAPEDELAVARVTAVLRRP